MSLFKPQETDDSPCVAMTGRTREAAPAADTIVIPFPGPEARKAFRIPRSDERRGEILLFLGVRYERLAS
ncbi:hypothetical protein MKK69_11710 [Methylobacterium sp. J-026]|uniref:hypothetical protein n=1 Tax=Methylobacterium sp. J-026 TaxID=2836624 RepID=UPI001FB9E084|nr:hypothetical protein [Methylobacterium sp. J-026]MCJ2134716.1 hypothetical protein [Methylobacterium sp. J-026]